MNFKSDQADQTNLDSSTKEQINSDDRRSAKKPSKYTDIISTDKFIAYSATILPRCTSNAPLSLSDINYVFLFLTDNMSLSAKDVMTHDKNDTNLTLGKEGLNLFYELISLPPDVVYISQSDIEHALSVLKFPHFDVNNLIKQADKYGDKDGFCGYVDFLNITKIAGLW